MNAVVSESRYILNRAGQFVENLSGEAAYRSFRPAPLPPSPPLQLDEAGVRMLARASRSLQRLDDLSRYVPDVDLFISSYVRKEALMSSQIEGTQCTLEDVLDPGAASSADADVAEVVNYVKAMRFATGRLDALPLCCRLLRETHGVLMDGARGREKSPGTFRGSQNWIGPGGAGLKDARYVPPNVDDMQAALDDLERFLNGERAHGLDPLVRAALVHYQFETIHPFLDGNGRIGRLLILLCFMHDGLLGKPVAYVSYFLKKNQVEYYDRMSEVRRSGNYEQWVVFFLEAVDAAAANAIDSIGRMRDLHRAHEALVRREGRAKKNLLRMLAHAERSPVFSMRSAAEALGLSYNGTAAQVAKLVELGIVEETTNAARNRVFAYRDLLAILKEDT